MKVKITSDGTTTRVVDIDTQQELQVYAVNIVQEVGQPMKCFLDMRIQATIENIELNVEVQDGDTL